MKGLSILFILMGALFLGGGNLTYEISGPVHLSPYDFIFAKFGNPEAIEAVKNKETRDLRRDLAIRIMIAGVIFLGIGILCALVTGHSVKEGPQDQSK
jgi:hypothetical protein